MKRIISILMVISIMILSVGTAFAATFDESVSKGINITVVEDKNGLITLTATAVDTEKVTSYGIRLQLDGSLKLVKSATDLTQVAETTTASDIVAVTQVGSSMPTGWQVSPTAISTYSSTELRFVFEDKNITGFIPTNNIELFKLYFVKADSNVALSTSAVTYYATAGKYSYISYSTPVQSKKDTSVFGIKVTPYVAPVTGWTETGKTVDGEDVTVTVKFPTTADEKAGSDWTGTTSDKGSVVKSMFGKAATDLKGAKYENGVFTKGDYSVDYNGQTYYGIVDVTAGNYWAILIIESVSAN